MAKFKLPRMKVNKTSSVLAVWKSAINLILSRPKVLIPFLILAAIEGIALYLLASSPHFPVNKVLAPPIKSIWGEIYLHYPFIYDLLPKMFYYAKFATGIFIGSLLAGMAVAMIAVLSKKERVSIKAAFLSALRRYVSLFLLALILFTSVHFLLKQPQVFLIRYFRAGHPKLIFLGPVFWLNTFLPFFKFVLAVVLQGLFIYAIPYIMLKGKKFLAALLLGIRLFCRLWVKTLIVITLPMILYIPVTILRANSGYLMENMAPEVIVGVLFVGVLVGTLVVDCLLTVATTLLFMEATDES